MKMSERLIKKFENIKAQYVKAFKNKLYDLCRKLGDELFEIVEQLRAQGIKNTDLGLSPDGEYIIRSFEMVAKNPTSPHADAIIADAKRCYNGNCTSTERKFTMIGMEIVEITDGVTRYLEPEPEEPKADIPDILMHTRNFEFETSIFPEICSLDCPHHQCSSYGTAQVGKPCRNRTPTNTELFGKPNLPKPPTT